MKLVFIILISLTFFNASSQPRVYHGVIEENDTLLISSLPTIVVDASKWSFSDRELRVLRYRMNKVYPYAKEAINLYYHIEDSLVNLKKKRHKRKVIRSTERELKGDYLKELKNLSISQGKVLMMLISRGTNRSCYDIIKTYKGGLKASYWQGIAHFFTYDLKEIYDPAKNPEFEMIVQEIELKKK